MNKTVQILNNKLAYDGFFQLKEITLRHSVYRGGLSAPLTRELFNRGETVIVLPYDETTDEVVLVEQFRIGGIPNSQLEQYSQNLMSSTNSKEPSKQDLEQDIEQDLENELKLSEAWMIEAVAGIIDSGEQPLEAAKRELLEETGLTGQSFHYWGDFYPSAGGCNEKFYMYLALVDSQNLQPYGGTDEGEDIRVFKLPLSEAIQWNKTNKIKALPLTYALLRLQQFRNR